MLVMPPIQDLISLLFKFTSGDVTSDMILVNKFINLVLVLIPSHRAWNLSILQFVYRYENVKKCMCLYRENKRCLLQKRESILKIYVKPSSVQSLLICWMVVKVGMKIQHLILSQTIKHSKLCIIVNNTVYLVYNTVYLVYN